LGGTTAHILVYALESIAQGATAVREEQWQADWQREPSFGALLPASSSLAIAMALTRLEATGLALDRGFYLGAAVLFLAAAAVPWLIVEGLWQWARRRHFWDWQ
jgi:hypothetical protein